VLLLVDVRSGQVTVFRRQNSTFRKLFSKTGRSCVAYTISEKGIRFRHPDYDPDLAQKLISSSMSRHLLTRKISSKFMHAFLSNLANRQTDRQTNAGDRIYSKCDRQRLSMIYLLLNSWEVTMTCNSIEPNLAFSGLAVSINSTVPGDFMMF